MSNDSGGEIRWHTITYRTLFGIVLLVAVAVGLVVQILRPEFFPSIAKFASRYVGSAAAGDTGGLTATARQAHFLNLEGEVQVRKNGSASFTPASLNTPLDRGDTVQTQENGWARIQFADETTYLLKPSSLIVIEQNNIAPDSAEIAVNVTSGMVDLTTGRNEGRTTNSRVRFADAAAALTANSRAEVDSRSSNASLTLLSGSADVHRGNEEVKVEPFQRLNIEHGHPLETEAVVQSPRLLTPGNLSPVLTTNPAHFVTNFSWTSVPDAQHYRLRLSQSPFLSTVYAERESDQTSTKFQGLPPGSYYWSVFAINGEGKESGLMEINKFTLSHAVPQADLKLTVDRVVQLGRVLEIDGHTDAGTKVLVNDEIVGLVESDGSFKHLTAPYPHEGTFTVTVTAEDNSGRVTIRKRKVTIQ
jgi:hypothetical protein